MPGTSPDLAKILKHKATSFLLYLLLLSVLAFLCSAPEGVKTTYFSIYIRVEPLLYYLESQCIVLLITKLYLEFKESKESSLSRFIVDKCKEKLFPVLIFLFPFFFYFPRTIPINNLFAGIGNDFIPITYSHKVFLLDYLSKFQIPLWSPGRRGRIPFLF